MRLPFIFAIGILFGLGISVSGMANPAKVINFFDIAGTWDPSLAFVMGGALTVTAIGYRFVFGRSKPIAAEGFTLPTVTRITPRLVAGSATFGVGWGIAGFCPGGALPVIGVGGPEVLLFLASMVAGIYTATYAGTLRRAPLTT